MWCMKKFISIQTIRDLCLCVCLCMYQKYVKFWRFGKDYMLLYLSLQVNCWWYMIHFHPNSCNNLVCNSNFVILFLMFSTIYHTILRTTYTTNYVSKIFGKVKILISAAEFKLMTYKFIEKPLRVDFIVYFEI